jgi:hypothetical protein
LASYHVVVTGTPVPRVRVEIRQDVGKPWVGFALWSVRGPTNGVFHDPAHQPQFGPWCNHNNIQDTPTFVTLARDSWCTSCLRCATLV